MPTRAKIWLFEETNTPSTAKRSLMKHTTETIISHKIKKKTSKKSWIKFRLRIRNIVFKGNLLPIR
jgi:hypothetical protein